MDFDYLSELSPKDLEKELRKANDAYRLGNPYMSDEVYDLLFDILKEKDPDNPFLTEISEPFIDEKRKVDLPYNLFSLNKIKNEPKVLENWVKKFPGNVIISEKLDGCSALFYIKDKQIYLFTRGSGYQGQNISHLLPYIQIFKNDNVRQFLIDNYPELAVRGELIISKKDWQEILLKYPDLSNARNAVAGTLNAKTPNPEILRKIKFIAYEWVAPGVYEPFQAMNYLKELQFIVVPYKLTKAKDVSLEKLSEYLMERRTDSEYEIDGIVVNENQVHPRDLTGNPKYSFAFKSLITQEQVEVVIIKVEWNISKDGVLKPLVYFPKVNLNGVDIQKATGFNAGFIEKNKVGPGAKAIIIRAGDVIPHILEITKSADSGRPSFPDIEYEWNETHIDIKISKTSVDSEVVKELEIRRLTHFFVSLDTEGVAEGVVKKLYNGGYTKLKQMLDLKVEDISSVEGFQLKSAIKIRNSITEALEKSTPVRLMVASNAFEGGFGERKLKSILQVYPDIADIDIRYIPTIEQLLTIEGVAVITADAFLKNLPNFWKFVEENKLEFVFLGKESKIKSRPMTSEVSNKKFVFTGFRSKELEDKIESLGGKLMSSVSGSTDYLVMKDPTEISGKTKKAVELGVKIISVEELRNLLL